MWKIRGLTDKNEILTFLESDRFYSAYAIGDLASDLFAQTIWVGAELESRLHAISLCFRGLQPPALFLMGNPSGVRAIFEAGHCPDKVYFLCRSEHLSITRDFYTWEKSHLMWRMVIRPEHFRPVSGDCVRLSSAHIDQMVTLFGHEGADAFSPAQVPDGVYFGIFNGEQLVSTAGTHLVSPTYNVAAVGNVYTHPDFRGRSFGTLTTSAVVAVLYQQGIDDIVLNVQQDNIAALRVYERLRFDRYCPFLEGPASAR